MNRGGECPCKEREMQVTNPGPSGGKRKEAQFKWENATEEEAREKPSMRMHRRCGEENGISRAKTRTRVRKHSNRYNHQDRYVINST